MKDAIIIAGVKLLVFIFFAGLAGSAVVVALTMLDDFRDVFGKSRDDEPAKLLES